MRSQSKRYLVAISTDDGKGVELFPMLQWCRDNPDRAPGDLVFRGKNSRALRRAFEKMGWSSDETETEVRLISPGSSVAFGALLDEAEELEAADIPEVLEDEDTVFKLENQLQEFISHNIESIRVGDKRLRLYTESGATGTEFSTDVGRIDILAVDEEGGFVVFELKRGNAPDRAIGQLARYMGWVRTHLANGRPVCGVIVAHEISKELRYAIAAFPNVELFEYQIKFALNPIVQVGTVEH
ncbi:endonuclease NucS domain-containing protein [Paraburkholderia sp. EG287A]|uniref:endonuclease NucS domain-containing protein n=1 Tax=unclassified Paraburkholderia TaxID=2615204 RepID=UPI0034D248B9